MSLESNNSRICLESLNDFSPVLRGWRKNFFTVVALVITGLAILVQRAVYRSLMQSGTRTINQMITPSQVRFYFCQSCMYSLTSDCSLI